MTTEEQLRTEITLLRAENGRLNIALSEALAELAKRRALVHDLRGELNGMRLEREAERMAGRG